MIATNFLRKQNKNNAKLLSTESINYNKIITSSESEIPSFNDTTTTTITTTKETIELNPNVKSSTLTRLQVLISGENDRFAKKNFNFVSDAYREKPHRIFPRSDHSPVQVIPVRVTEHKSDNESALQLSEWQQYENG
ncbi:unnamed protein product, partial [Brugia pahangi]|uniref:Uncharacterized protein n=1 Tax=Brugia pahangi TaxID=6280 RepID=A0A0N4TD74_BRUPA